VTDVASFTVIFPVKVEVEVNVIVIVIGKHQQSIYAFGSERNVTISRLPFVEISLTAEKVVT
jgi:hypothetical protein